MSPTAESERRPWAEPILRWAGSKRALVPRLLELVPAEIHRYVEPFAGSACLFFALRPPQAVLGDLNAELIATYETLRAHPWRVAQQVAALSQTNTAYYKVRADQPDTLGDVERAVRFIYLNRLCFNGVYRTNRKNEFNVPRGRRTGEIPSPARFYRCSVALRDAELRAGDFRSTLPEFRRGDFIYLDPPYSRSARGNYGVYGYGSFDRREMSDLRAVLDAIDGAGARFLLSYVACPELTDLPRGWSTQQVSVRSQVGGKAETRTLRDEILVANYRLET